jgi:acetyl-CoA carboxylase carboxyltransferase component
MNIEITDEMVDAGLAARTQAEYTAAGEKLIRAMPELIDEIGRLRTERDEILQAHTALVARLHDVTTMLEAERARIAGAPVGIVDAEMVVPDGFRLYPEDLWDKRVALVVLDKVTP